MIGLLTYCHISNYGANFRTFALQHSILETSREVMIIKCMSHVITKERYKDSL